MKKLMVIPLLTLLFPIAANAYNACINDIYYSFSGNEAVVTYGTSENFPSGTHSSSVVIPEFVTYHGINYRVTTIGYRAFDSNKTMSSVTIPSSITSIRISAFNGCEGLIDVYCYAKNVPRTDGSVFNNSPISSATLHVPEESIDLYKTAGIWKGFGTIVSLKEADAFVDGIYYNFSGNDAVVTCRTPYYNSYSGSVIIPEFVTCNDATYKVTGISNSAFYNCMDLTSVVIPNSVTYIDPYAFSRCSNLTSVTIGNGVTSIRDEAFSYCPKLKNIYVTAQIPADCEGMNTFLCPGNDVRDKYDIYNYAVLHVPMGTKEEYAAAYEWRYFAKIKEDLDINGQVFYTTLSVNHAGDGYVKHYVKADEPYTLYIGSEDGMRINTVLFNGEDVTDRLVDGYYTTPNITRPSKIVVSYEQDPDGIAYIPAEDNLHVYGNEGSLFISGIEEPQLMSVYTLNGILVNSQTLEGDARIKISEGTYIVKIGKRTFKVLM